MRILVLCDDHYHPGNVPEAGVKLLDSEMLSFDVMFDAAEFETGMLADYDVVIMSKADHTSGATEDPWKTYDVQKALVDFVSGGKGLVVTHSGTVAGKNTAVLDNLIGCKFKFHPAICPVTVDGIKPHPVMSGVNLFKLTDEHYHLDILQDDVNIVAAAYADAQGDASKYESDPYFNAPAAITPAVLTRTEGKGRVCVIASGHTEEVWTHPDFQTLLKNAVLWTSCQ